MSILLDVMGGTRAPEAAIAAAAAISLQSELEITLIGDEVRLTPALARIPHDPSRLLVRHAAPLDDTTSPARASLCKASQLLADGQGSALVTAGDSADLLYAAGEHLDLLPGAPRGALCAVYPTARRRGSAHDPYVLLLDVGASFTATAEDLLGYARMGSAYASSISRNRRPRVAVLACEIGGELGPPAVAKAAQLLQAAPDLNYIGHLSSQAIPLGQADVILCDGYTGSTVMRLLEGVGSVVEQLARSASKQNIKWRLAFQMISDGMGKMQSVADWKNYGGAPLLGYSAPIIAVDSASDQDAMSRAIRLAAKAVRLDITSAVRRGLDT